MRSRSEKDGLRDQAASETAHSRDKGDKNMTGKQQLATGFLAMLIVGSVAFMPVNAGVKEKPAPAPQPASVVASHSSSEPPQDEVKDLTYN
jgi:hypothetical protein